MRGRVGAAIKRHPTVFAALCGLVVAACGWLSGDAVFGTGYAQARALVQGDDAMPATFGVLKLLATVASSVSGIPGGIFAPSLAVGAGLGADMAWLLPGAPACRRSSCSAWSGISPAWCRRRSPPS